MGKEVFLFNERILMLTVEKSLSFLVKSDFFVVWRNVFCMPIYIQENVYY